MFSSARTNLGIVVVIVVVVSFFLSFVLLCFCEENTAVCHM